MVAFYTLSNVLIKSMASPLSFFIVNGYPAIKSAKKRDFFKVDKLSKWNDVCRKNSLFIKKILLHRTHIGFCNYVGKVHFVSSFNAIMFGNATTLKHFLPFCTSK